MGPFRIVNIVLTVLMFAVTESALAVCADPLPSGAACCDYPTTVMDPTYPVYQIVYKHDPVTTMAACTDLAYTNFPSFVILLTDSAGQRCSLSKTATVGPLISGSPSWQEGTLTFPYWNGAANCYRATYSMRSNLTTPPVACEIEAMPPFSATDACSMELEANNGLPGPATTCPAVPVMTRTSGEPSFKTKMETIGIPYAGPTSTIRTTAYNQHLATVWKYHERHQRLSTNPNQWYACTARRAVVEAEVTTKHGLTYPPAIISRHLTGRAFDVSRTVIADLRQSGVFIPAILIRTPVSTLNWGGRFRIPDRVHFELNVP